MSRPTQTNSIPKPEQRIDEKEIPKFNKTLRSLIFIDIIKLI